MRPLDLGICIIICDLVSLNSDIGEYSVMLSVLMSESVSPSSTVFGSWAFGGGSDAWIDENGDDDAVLAGISVAIGGVSCDTAIGDSDGSTTEIGPIDPEVRLDLPLADSSRISSLTKSSSSFV